MDLRLVNLKLLAPGMKQASARTEIQEYNNTITLQISNNRLDMLPYMYIYIVIIIMN